MVLEHRGEHPSLWAAIESIAPMIGCVPQTLHEWARMHQVETGMRDGVTRAAVLCSDPDHQAYARLPWDAPAGAVARVDP